VTDAFDPSATSEHDVAPAPTPEAIASHAIDLDAIESDFAAVETALARLAEGTYWTDETTGAAIPDDVMIIDPTARQVPQG